MENDDTPQGGESLSIDQAAAAYAKSITPPAVQQDHVESDEDQVDGTTTDDELQPGDEPEGEEDGGETAEEDDAAEGVDDEPETDQGRFVADNAKVRLPDGTVTTVHELKRGNLREADYTRGKQDLSTRLKDTESRDAQVKASQQQLQERAEYVESLIQAIVPAEPDYSLADPASPNYDPIKYQADEAKYRAWSQHLNALQQQRQQDGQSRQAEQQKQFEARVTSEHAALLEKVPAFKDTAKLTAFANDLKKYGPTFGLTPQDIQSVALDHRYAIILREAIGMRKLQANKANVAKKVENRPPVQRGGKRLNPSEARARGASDAINRLKETGSEADAVAAYLATRKTG